MNYIGKEDAQLKLFEAIFPETRERITKIIPSPLRRGAITDRQVNSEKAGVRLRKINLSRLKEIFAKNQKNGRCVSRKNLETFGITDLIPRLEKIGRKVV